METIEEIGFGGLKLIQDSDGFRFGVDAVIIADFACRLNPHAKAVADLGTGNGIIPLVMSHKNRDCRILGIDVQEKAIQLADRNKSLNGLENRLEFVCTDINDLQSLKPELKGSLDTVVTNPPYVPVGGGLTGADDSRHIARQETTADLEGFISTASWLLKDRGHFFIVQRPSRLADLFYYCREYRLEPKHMRLVTPHVGEKPNIVMVHCVRGGGRELTVLEELAVRDKDGGYTGEIERIYER